MAANASVLFKSCFRFGRRIYLSRDNPHELFLDRSVRYLQWKGLLSLPDDSLPIAYRLGIIVKIVALRKMKKVRHVRWLVFI